MTSIFQQSASMPRFPSRIYRVLLIGLLVFLASAIGCAEDTKPPSADTRKGLGPYSLVIAEDAGSVTYRNPDGQAVRVQKHPKRTVGLLTSLLSLWYEAGGTAVGRNSTRQFVPETIRDLPTVGTFANLNVERILTLQPDFVISADLGNIRAVSPVLEANGIGLAFFRYNNFYDYRAIFELFGKINGTEARSRDILANVQQRIDGVVDRAGKQPPKRALIMFTTPNIINCELPNSHTGVMLDMLGAENIIQKGASTHSMRVNFSMERIVELDPDVILINTMGDVGQVRDRLARELLENEAWRALRAVRENNIHYLPKTLFLYKPNAQFPRSLEYLAAVLYPEAFPEVNFSTDEIHRQGS